MQIQIIMRFKCLDCDHAWTATYEPFTMGPDEVWRCPVADVPVDQVESLRGPDSPSARKKRRDFRKGGVAIRVRHTHTV